MHIHEDRIDFLLILILNTVNKHIEWYLQSFVVLTVGEVELSRHVDEVIANQAGVSLQSFFYDTQR